MSFDVISVHVVSCQVILSRHFMSCHVLTSCHVILRHFTSGCVMSCHFVTSLHVMLVRVVSCHFMSSSLHVSCSLHVMSLEVVSCYCMSCAHLTWLHVMSCHFISCHVMSRHFMSCYVTARHQRPHGMSLNFGPKQLGATGSISAILIDRSMNPPIETNHLINLSALIGTWLVSTSHPPHSLERQSIHNMSVQLFRAFIFLSVLS